jgi:hypothetical protein
VFAALNNVLQNLMADVSSRGGNDDRDKFPFVSVIRLASVVADC